jgi:two-component system KDP operon response regulator KdpE
MTYKPTILLADDDLSLRKVLGALLQEEGFNVILAADGSECLRKAYDTHPDLVLLDIMMPSKDGRVVCRQLREISSVPIIMLTAVPHEKEKVDRFADGADDYVTKPFNNDELIARIRAILRRTQKQSSKDRLEPYDDGHLLVNLDSRQVRVGNRAIHFAPKEWRLLECLLIHRGKVVEREELLRFVWGEGYEKEYNYLKVYVSHLRRKLGDPSKCPRYIHSQRQVGYRFEGRA